MIIFVIGGLIFPANTVFASDYTDELTIQTVWVTGNKSCYHNDEQRLAEYNDEIILNYLSFYGIKTWSYEPQCLTEQEYENYQPPQYTDLLIVIYNKNIGRDILHARNIGGYFQSADYIHTSGLRIEVCECLSSQLNDPVWVLSHELAHFALFYLGTPQDVWVDWVHDIQSKYYYYCPDGDTTNPNCNGLYFKYEGTNRNYKVMALYTPAIGVEPPQKKFVTFPDNEQSLPELNYDIETAFKDSDGDGIFDTNDKCTWEQEIVNSYKDFDGCPDSIPIAVDWKSKALKIQGQVNSKIEAIKPGVYIAENSLSGAYFDNPTAQKELENAWTAVWWAKKYLSDAEWTQREGSELISESNFKDAYYKHEYSLASANKIDKYLFEINDHVNKAHSILSQYQANKENNKSCFLFWCW